jgi:hypothetical protein
MPIAVLHVTLEYTPSISFTRKAYASATRAWRSGRLASGGGGVDDVDHLLRIDKLPR